MFRFQRILLGAMIKPYVIVPDIVLLWSLPLNYQGRTTIWGNSVFCRYTHKLSEPLISSLYLLKNKKTYYLFLYTVVLYGRSSISIIQYTFVAMKKTTTEIINKKPDCWNISQRRFKRGIPMSYIYNTYIQCRGPFIPHPRTCLLLGEQGGGNPCVALSVHFHGWPECS